MLVIRFSRVGRRNHVQYRIVVQEKSKAPTGKHIAIVGSYDPHSKQAVLKEEEIKRYLENGAQPSDSVYNLLVRNEVITGAKRVVKLPAKKVEEVAEDSDEAKEEKADNTEEKTQEVEEKKEEKKEEAPAEEKKEEKAEKAEEKK